MKKVIIKCFYKIKFSIFACNFLVNIIICVLYGGCVNRRKTYILYKTILDYDLCI